MESDIWIAYRDACSRECVGTVPSPNRGILKRSSRERKAKIDTGGAAFEFVRGCHVDAARVQPSGALLLELSTADGARCLEVDTLISLTGFKPDAALHSELHASAQRLNHIDRGFKARLVF